METGEFICPFRMNLEHQDCIGGFCMMYSMEHEGCLICQACEALIKGSKTPPSVQYPGELIKKNREV